MKETSNSLTMRQVIFPTLISQEDDEILSQDVSDKFSCAEREMAHFIFVQKCRNIRGLGCVNQARAKAQVTQPIPRILLHFCTSVTEYLDRSRKETKRESKIYGRNRRWVDEKSLPKRF